MIINKRIMDKIIKESIKAVSEGGTGVRAVDEFSYRGFRVQVVIETKVIRNYELPAKVKENEARKRNLG